MPQSTIASLLAISIILIPTIVATDLAAQGPCPKGLQFYLRASNTGNYAHAYPNNTKKGTTPPPSKHAATIYYQRMNTYPNGEGYQASPYTFFFNQTSNKCALTLPGLPHTSPEDARSILIDPPGSFNPGNLCIAAPQDVAKAGLDYTDVSCHVNVTTPELVCQAIDPYDQMVTLNNFSILDGRKFLEITNTPAFGIGQHILVIPVDGTSS